MHNCLFLREWTVQEAPNFFVLLALTITSYRRLVGFISVSTGTWCGPRDNWCLHACRFALLVNFIDFDGRNISEKEKRNVYFFGNEITEELRDLIGVYNFGADFASDSPQRTPNDSTFECSVIPSMVKEPIKRWQLIGVGAKTLREINSLAIRIREAFEWIGNSEKWPWQYLWTIGGLHCSWGPGKRVGKDRSIRGTQSEIQCRIFQSFCMRHQTSIIKA